MGQNMVFYYIIGLLCRFVRLRKDVLFLKIDVMGVQFDNVTMDEALARFQSLLNGEKAAYCVTPNAEIVYEAMQSEELLSLLNQADLVLPDGAGVIKSARILGTPLKEKVAGIDFAGRVMELLQGSGKTLYLLGGKPGVAAAAAEKLREKYPGLVISGYGDGYFKDEEAVVNKINITGADVLFVCLGAPKQEYFMQRNQEKLQVKFMAGLGGSLDNFAGYVKRAPKWMIAMNLEWLYRLIREPWRFKRMLRLPKLLSAVKKRRKENDENGKANRI